MAFVAGGSSGIYLGVAHSFDEAGAKVAPISRSAEKIEAAAQGLRDRGLARNGRGCGAPLDADDERLANDMPIDGVPCDSDRDEGPDDRIRMERH